MIKETLIYQGDSKWSRNAYIKFVGDKIVFDRKDYQFFVSFKREIIDEIKLWIETCL